MNIKPTARTLLAGAILAAICTIGIGLIGCATTSAVVATVKDCADATTHSATLGILDDVSAVLICDSGNASALPGCVVSRLEAIAVNAGWVAIDCAIAEIQSKAANNVNASGDPTELIRWRRAKDVEAARAGGKLGPAS